MSPNRYAWTTAGPVIIRNGAQYSTATCKRRLAKLGIEVTSWGRNFMSFAGWVHVLDVEL